MTEGKLFAVIGLIALLGIGVGGAQEKKEEKRDPVLEAYYQANGLFNRQLYPLAEDAYRAFLAKNGGHAKAGAARTGLAMSVFRQKKYAEAAPLIAALAGDPKHPQAAALVQMHAQCLLETGKEGEAEKAFAAAVNLGGVSEGFKARCRVGMIEALYRQKKWKEVSARSAEFLKTKGNEVLATRVRTQSATAMYELKDFAGAAVALQMLGADKKALGQHGVFLLAECKRRLGDRKSARAGYEMARAMEGPYVAQALYRIGFLEFRDKRYDPAIKIFLELKRKHAKSPATLASRLLLGRCYFEKKNWGQAKATFAQVGSAEGEFWRARCSLQANNATEAASVLRAAIGKYPKDALLPDLRFELAGVLFKDKKYLEAAASLAELIKAHPKFERLGEARRLRAYCLHEEKKYGESLAECEAALKAGPEPAAAEELGFLRAENLFLLDRDEAVQAYREFVAKHGSSKRVGTANLRIGQVLYGKEQWAEAGKIFEALVKGNTKREGAFGHVDFFAGECAFGTGEKAKAAQHYERYLSAAKPDGKYRDSAHFKLASVYAEVKREGDAIRVFGELDAKFPKSPHRPAALIELGRLYLAAKDAGKALDRLTAFTTEYPSHELKVRAQYYLGWVFLSGDRDPQAREQFAAVVANRKRAGEVLAGDAAFQLAMLAVRAEDYPTAAKALEPLLGSEKDPARLQEATFYLGLSRARQKQWGPAREVLLKLGGEPASAWRERALYELAWCEKELKKPQEAKKWYEALVKEFANGEFGKTAVLELAELDYESGDFAAAVNRLQPLLQSSDRVMAARAAHRLGWCHFESGKFGEAAVAFETLLGMAEAPAELIPVAAYQAGEAKLRVKDFAGAQPHYQRAAEEAGKVGNPLAERALLRLAEVQGIGAKHSEALATCDQFLAKHAQSEHLTRVQFVRGWALENLARHDEAIVEYAKVLAAGKRDVTSARSQFQIGECHLAKGKFDEAIKAFVQVEVSFGNAEWTPKALLEIGTALERKGEKEKARAQYEEVLEKFADSASAKVARQRLGR